uniref:Uncharacterized protein n=1 Tax=Trypanosoma congolense (strain IL3000) TaxID=1068625 RepID=G0UYT4_TRYCI|nr:conserved hypothetical protein [Trypanosoma congolense IL3000]
MLTSLHVTLPKVRTNQRRRHPNRCLVANETTGEVSLLPVAQLLQHDTFAGSSADERKRMNGEVCFRFDHITISPHHSSTFASQVVPLLKGLWKHFFACQQKESRTLRYKGEVCTYSKCNCPTDGVTPYARVERPWCRCCSEELYFLTRSVFIYGNHSSTDRRGLFSHLAKATGQVLLQQVDTSSPFSCGSSCSVSFSLVDLHPRWGFRDVLDTESDARHSSGAQHGRVDCPRSGGFPPLKRATLENRKTASQCIAKAIKRAETPRSLDTTAEREDHASRSTLVLIFILSEHSNEKEGTCANKVSQFAPEKHYPWSKEQGLGMEAQFNIILLPDSATAVRCRREAEELSALAQILQACGRWRRSYDETGITADVQSQNPESFQSALNPGPYDGNLNTCTTHTPTLPRVSQILIYLLRFRACCTGEEARGPVASTLFPVDDTKRVSANTCARCHGNAMDCSASAAECPNCAYLVPAMPNDFLVPIDCFDAAVGRSSLVICVNSGSEHYTEVRNALLFAQRMTGCGELTSPIPYCSLSEGTLQAADGYWQVLQRNTERSVFPCEIGQDISLGRQSVASCGCNEVVAPARGRAGGNTTNLVQPPGAVVPGDGDHSRVSEDFPRSQALPDPSHGIPLEQVHGLKVRQAMEWSAAGNGQGVAPSSITCQQHQAGYEKQQAPWCVPVSGKSGGSSAPETGAGSVSVRCSHSRTFQSIAENSATWLTSVFSTPTEGVAPNICSPCAGRVASAHASQLLTKRAGAGCETQIPGTTLERSGLSPEDYLKAVGPTEQASRLQHVGPKSAEEGHVNWGSTKQFFDYSECSLAYASPIANREVVLSSHGKRAVQEGMELPRWAVDPSFTAPIDPEVVKGHQMVGNNMPDVTEEKEGTGDPLCSRDRNVETDNNSRGGVRNRYDEFSLNTEVDQLQQQVTTHEAAEKPSTTASPKRNPSPENNNNVKSKTVGTSFTMHAAEAAAQASSVERQLANLEVQLLLLGHRLFLASPPNGPAEAHFTEKILGMCSGDENVKSESGDEMSLSRNLLETLSRTQEYLRAGVAGQSTGGQLTKADVLERNLCWKCHSNRRTQSNVVYKKFTELLSTLCARITPEGNFDRTSPLVVQDGGAEGRTSPAREFSPSSSSSNSTPRPSDGFTKEQRESMLLLRARRLSRSLQRQRVQKREEMYRKAQMHIVQLQEELKKEQEHRIGLQRELMELRSRAGKTEAKLTFIVNTLKPMIAREIKDLESLMQEHKKAQACRQGGT